MIVVCRVLNFCNTICDKGRIATVAVVNPLENGSTVTQEVKRVNWISVLFLHRLCKRIHIYNCSLDLNFRDAEFARYCHDKSALDQIIVVKDSKKCDGAEGGCGFVAEDMDLDFR